MRGGARQRTTCSDCGKEVAARSNGSGPMAHKCPHGGRCVRPAWLGGIPGGTPLGCAQCRAARTVAPAAPGAADLVVDPTWFGKRREIAPGPELAPVEVVVEVEIKAAPPPEPPDEVA